MQGVAGCKATGPGLAKIAALTDTNPAVAQDFGPVRSATIVEAAKDVGRVIRGLDAGRLVLLLPEQVRYAQVIQCWRHADDVLIRPRRHEIFRRVLRDCRIVDYNETEYGDQCRESD